MRFYRLYQLVYRETNHKTHTFRILLLFFYREFKRQRDLVFEKKKQQRDSEIVTTQSL